MTIEQCIRIEFAELRVLEQNFDGTDVQFVEYWMKSHKFYRIDICFFLILLFVISSIRVIKAKFNKHAPAIIVIILKTLKTCLNDLFVIWHVRDKDLIIISFVTDYTPDLLFSINSLILFLLCLIYTYILPCNRNLQKTKKIRKHFHFLIVKCEPIYELLLFIKASFEISCLFLNF